MILGVVSVGISGTTEKPCNDEAYALFTDVTKYVDWIKQTVGSGYLSEDRLGINTRDEDEEVSPIDQIGAWKDKGAFCEYITDAG